MAGRIMLAVLPFENLTGDTAQDYFSDGLTEEMIAQLGRVDPGKLGVIARTSVMRYKQYPRALEQIGHELGVQYVLEGSVRREAGTVRVSAQLIQLKDQTHLWSRQYDREPSNLLTLQREIAREVSDEIELTFDGHRPSAPVPESTSSPLSSEAYDFYLKGLYFWNKRTAQDFLQAIDYFQQAIAKDANYAPAYTGLANSYTLLTGYTSSPGAKYMLRARAAALRALEIDPNLAEAHTALALVVQNYDFDWQTAEREFKRGIELNPNYATGHHWYAEHLMWRGQSEEALRESERARQLDPLSLIIATDHAAILYNARQYDQAIEQLRDVREMDPQFPRSAIVFYAYVEKGMFTEALSLTEENLRQYGDGRWHWAALAIVYGRSGQRERARRELLKIEHARGDSSGDPCSIAIAYAASGERDKALTVLEKAYVDHYSEIVRLKVEPLFDPLRNDPRFQDLLRRAGLGP